LFFWAPGLCFPATYHIFPAGELVNKGERKDMMKKLLVLLLTSVLTFPLATAVFAQDAPAKEKVAKESRWEGNILRSSKDESSLTVRKVGSTDERIVKYDSSTRWVSQEHGSKKVNNIDASEVKDGDRVICKGTLDKDGVLHATLISKRLTGM
jgi:hypothetical protein